MKNNQHSTDLAAQPFAVENIRFDVEPGGNAATIWFDLTGQRFAEPEAMTNLFVDFDDFLEDLQAHDPALFAEAKDRPKARHARTLDRLNAQHINWPDSLHGYVARQINIQAAENERLVWLSERRARAADPAWASLTAAGQNTDPSWDEVANHLLESMNTAIVNLYPELEAASSDTNAGLRETLEFHMHRLTNEVVGLVQESRREK